ncbi:Hypothetical predicted protein [Xyrichtys novacula]|uniref:Uncharacterized protein n=1 Tax=Xyrichtys novacula TaxID=13765 RepID=A0AAV1FE16_XYRNO|nr:Hypothetical predicted protein [Xyrichtys novacula]
MLLIDRLPTPHEDLRAGDGETEGGHPGMDGRGQRGGERGNKTGQRGGSDREEGPPQHPAPRPSPRSLLLPLPEEEEEEEEEEAVSELQACPCSFQVSPSALAPAKVTAVSATERAPDAPPPSVLGAQPGRR